MTTVPDRADNPASPATLRLAPAVEEALDHFCRSVRSRYGERLDALRLFGSYARGDAWEESDVDVLVLVRDATRQDADDIMALAEFSVQPIVWANHDCRPAI